MPLAYGTVNRALPATTADGQPAVSRLGRYGETKAEIITAGCYPIADEGSYFKAINPTPGTGIAQTIQASFLATNGVFSIRNSASAGGNRIYMDYLSLIVTAAPASATSSQIVVAVDSITRYSSGGTAITALQNVNMDVTRASVAVVHFGALTLAAESANVRRIARSVLRSSIPVVGDCFVIQFGSVDGAPSGSIAGASALSVVDPIGPAIIGPGHSLTVHVWHPGNVTTPASFEFEAGWWER